MTPSKADLRRELAARRHVLTAAERAHAAQAIAAHLHPLLSPCERVAAFSATRNEVDLGELYAALLRDGVSVCFPRVEGPGAMRFVDVRALDELVPGAFGIAEPPGPGVDVATVDAFLIPGLGFDRRGARLGFGGGYYDRALAWTRQAQKLPLLIGVGYSWQVLDETLPADDWDVPLSHLVTEEGLVVTARAGLPETLDE